MRKQRNSLPGLFFVMILIPHMVASCNIPVSAPVDTPIDTTISQSTRVMEFQTLPTSTVLVQPTDLTPTITSLPPVLTGDNTPIRFPNNGTYADVEVSIPAGASRSYSINAMKGQIMSISILPKIEEGQWGYGHFKLSGTDGALLCPEDVNSDCMFWRGVLPSSGEYILILSPEGDAITFTLRVAINPPDESVQYFEYKNPANGIILRYTDEFAPGLPPSGNYKSTPIIAFHYIDTTTYVKTNLSEAYFLVSASLDPQIVATCTGPNEQAGGPEYASGNKTVNGHKFIVSVSEGAGAGNYYEQIIHRSAINGACFEVIYFIHYTNIGNYPPDTVVEFDREALLQKFDAIFSTFGNR